LFALEIGFSLNDFHFGWGDWCFLVTNENFCIVGFLTICVFAVLHAIDHVRSQLPTREEIRLRLAVFVTSKHKSKCLALGTWRRDLVSLSWAKKRFRKILATVWYQKHGSVRPTFSEPFLRPR
jgi:hypothetical protein